MSSDGNSSGVGSVDGGTGVPFSNALRRRPLVVLRATFFRPAVLRPAVVPIFYLATYCLLSDCCLAGCRFATDSLPGCGLAHGRLATSSLTRSRFASDGLPGCGLARCGLATCSLTRSRFTTDGLPCCSLACSRLAGSSWSAASCHKSLGYARPRCARMDIVFLITRTGLYWPVSGARGLHRQLLACTALCTR
jgi:hypothetical protein